MKYHSASAIAFIIGMVSWFWMFALAFNYANADLWPAIAWPILCHGLAVGLLSVWAYRSWAFTTGIAIAPHLLVNLTCMAEIYKEGRGVEWAYLIELGLVLLVTLIGSLAGSWSRRLIWPVRS